MKRRDVLRAATVAPLLAVRARAEQTAPAAAPAGKWPGEEKLAKSKREITEAMAKVRLANSDAPDLLPRVRRRR